jgi:hypothetical protein
VSESETSAARPAGWRKIAGLVVALAGALWVGRLLGGSAPRETRVTVGLADHREGPSRAERVGVSFAQGGEVLQRVEQRFSPGAAVPARWARTVSLAPGRYRVRVEVVSERGLFSREEERDVGADGVDLRAPRE